MPNDWTSWESNIKWSDDKSKGNRWGGALSGAGTGASIGSTFGPIGAGVGALVGGIGGALFGGPKELSEAEKLANNWDALKGAATKQFGGQGISGMWGGIQDFQGALKEWGGKVPGLEQLYGSLGQGSAAAGQLMNYKPVRIDKAIGEEEAYRQNVNTNVNPMALRQRKQADQAALMRKGGPATGAQQQLMNRSDRQAAEQAIAEQGVGMIEGSRGRTAQLSQMGDQLVQRALEAGGNLYANLAQGYATASKLGLEGQTAYLEGLMKVPGLYQNFLAFLQPNQNQYDAAKAGGKDSGIWNSLTQLAQTGAQAYQAWKGGQTPAWSSSDAAAGRGEWRQPPMPDESRW
jgi:hypothetical protein